MQRHGWVKPMPNGIKARCGGPQVCFHCKLEALFDAAKEQVERHPYTTTHRLRVAVAVVEGVAAPPPDAADAGKVQCQVCWRHVPAYGGALQFGLGVKPILTKQACQACLDEYNRVAGDDRGDHVLRGLMDMVGKAVREAHV